MHTFSATSLHVVATDAHFFITLEVTSTLVLPFDNRPVDSTDESSSRDFPA